MAEIKKRENLEISIERLKEFPQNSRTHTKAQIELIARSLKEFGWTNPLLIDDSFILIAGHARLEAAKQFGMTTVPCVQLSGLTEAQKRALVIADNQLAIKGAGWNHALLDAELKFLHDAGFDVGLTGFSILKFNPPNEDALPDVPATPRSKSGDVWRLGEHRVMCGDSTAKISVSELLMAVKPGLMVTDPPYGVEYDADWRNHTADETRTGRATGKVLNDDRADWRAAWELFHGAVAYVWHAGLFSPLVAESLVACGFELRSQIIWAKNNFALSRGDYHWKHEPCWYAVRAGSTANFQGDRKQSTVWDIEKPQKSETGHSTQKPVDCMRKPMLNSSVKGDVIYDPFLGSGTSIIAAETCGRICYGMELNPAYVDVIVKRWQSFTGKIATLERTGENF